jgi:hypothetical protein
VSVLQALPIKSAGKKKAHQMLAWGVLGSASDGLPFSLLTLLFSGVFVIIKPYKRDEFRRIL